MDDRSLFDALRAYEPAFRENGATALFVFGSRARNTHRPDSDLDLFIDYDADIRIPSLFKLMELEEKLSQEFGMPVTITTRAALHPLMKNGIERDAVRIL